ncbi:hypothetical protein AOLI_G00061650 [Acnodon oligacanthus]
MSASRSKNCCCSYVLYSSPTLESLDRVSEELVKDWTPAWHRIPFLKPGFLSASFTFEPVAPAVHFRSIEWRPLCRLAMIDGHRPANTAQYFNFLLGPRYSRG